MDAQHEDVYKRQLFPWAVSLFAVPWVIADDLLHKLGLTEAFSTSWATTRRTGSTKKRSCQERTNPPEAMASIVPAVPGRGGTVDGGWAQPATAGIAGRTTTSGRWH